jgi:signal transduction histidine kinase
VSAAVVLALAALAGSWMAVRAVVADDGAPVIADPGFGSGLTVDPLADGVTGLRPNDVVVAVDAVSLDDWLRGSSRSRPRVRDGAELTYRVQHGAHTRDVPVVLGHDSLTVDRLRANGGIVLAAVAIFLLSLYTVWRRPDVPAARALFVFGGGLVAYTVFTSFAYDTADVAGARAVFLFGHLGGVAALTVWSAAATHLALTFPAPPAALVRNRWSIPALYGVALLLTAGAQGVLLLSGRATLAGLDALTSAENVVLTVLALAALAALVRTLARMRRDEAIRAQGALVAAGLAVTAVAVLTANLVAGDRKWPAWFDAALFLPLPVTIAVAIVQGRFLGIRAVVNRTLVYASLTAILLGVYAGAVAAVGAVVGDTGLSSTFLATGVVAVAFAPLRGSLQHAVDRLLYGERGDPSKVLGALGHRLEAAVPPDEVLPVITETVATTLNLPYVALRTGAGPDARLACERGEPVRDPHIVPLVHQGVAVGELLVGPRRGERAVSASDQEVLADIARQIATAVSAAGLYTQLVASRSRLAVAREEERARLRHDLHDRLGPHLVGLSLQLDTLQRQVGEPSTAAALGAAHDEATRALDEVRRISRGLRPAELDELGLVEAIGAAAARLSVADDQGAWHASVDAALQLGAMPADVEVAAYQIALEALSNAYRHSGGRAARVRLGIDAAGSQLTVEIADDGRGIDPDATAGVGIQSMRERAGSVRGELRIRDAASGGTVVSAILPLVDDR